MEQFIESPEDMAVIESCLRDYEGLSHLIEIIKELFNTLCNKIDLKLS
jgi:hypothetical protein